MKEMEALASQADATLVISGGGGGKGSVLTLLISIFVLFGLSFTLSSCKKCSKDNPAGRNNAASTPTTPNLNPPILPLVLTSEVAKRVACDVMKEAREAYRAKEAASKALPSWGEQKNKRGVADKKIQTADGEAAKAEAARDRALAQVTKVEKLDTKEDVVVIERVKFAKVVAMYATIYAAEARYDVAISQSEVTEKLRAWWDCRGHHLDMELDEVRSAKNAMRDKRLDASDVEAIKRFVEVKAAEETVKKQGKEAFESWEKARDERKNKGFDYEEGEEHDLNFDGEDEEHDLNLGDK